MKKEIQYKKGDATAPVQEGNKIIVHICNDIGGWGKGFVVAVSKRWPAPEKQYREWSRKEDFKLGEVRLVQVEKDLWVANLIGQHKLGVDESGTPPIRYEAVAKGLQAIRIFAEEQQASVHMPRIGCGLAGGSWDRMAPLIEENLASAGIEVTVYDF